MHKASHHARDHGTGPSADREAHGGHGKTAASHAGHDRHAGHTPEMFRDRFWLSLILTIPVVIWAEHIQTLFGYTAPVFPGSRWISPVLATIVFLYGGLVFLKGAWHELKARLPGMMTLISLAITVALVFSWIEIGRASC